MAPSCGRAGGAASSSVVGIMKHPGCSQRSEWIGQECGRQQQRGMSATIMNSRLARFVVRLRFTSYLRYSCSLRIWSFDDERSSGTSRLSFSERDG